MFFDTHKELALGSRLNLLSENLMRETSKIYKHYNIDFDPYLFPVFKIICDRETVTITEIFNLLNVSQPAITQSVHKLKAKGLISLKSDDTDKRKKNISLSKKGGVQLKRLQPIWTAIDNTIKDMTSFQSENLVGHLDELQNNLNEKNMSERVIELIEKNKLDNIDIIAFEPKYAGDFKDLNIAWLEKYFVVEPHDAELLEQCEDTIIKKGGFIFFAKLHSKIVGCFSLIKVTESTYELGKMAVSEHYQGLKIGQKLMQFCIDFGKEQGWKSLILYSNTKLENAIYIYRKYGFKEIPQEAKTPYLRCNIKMELTL